MARKGLWPYLSPGDRVDVVAPGFRCSQEEVRKAAEFLESWGLKPRIPLNIFGRDVVCSNDDESRFLLLKEALMARDSQAVWCLRGGYGANRLLPRLSKFKAPPAKLFIGYSDAVSLHSFFFQKWKWATIHGPLLDAIGNEKIPQKSLSELKDLIFGEKVRVIHHNLRPMNSAARKTERVTGKITGGNLVVLQSLIGTPWKPTLRGKILFIEEVGERGYRVDRILEHLVQSGMLRGLKAMVIGDFIGGEEKSGEPLWPGVLRRFSEKQSFPIVKGVHAGHGEIQRPLPLGVDAILNLGASGSLVCPPGGK